MHQSMHLFFTWKTLLPAAAIFVFCGCADPPNANEPLFYGDTGFFSDARSDAANDSTPAQDVMHDPQQDAQDHTQDSQAKLVYIVVRFWA